MHPILCSVLGSIAAVALGSRPDVIPSNMRPVAVDLRIDVTALGPLAEVACLQHPVAAGETIASIAKAHLGDTARWTEIEALNPGLDPQQLPIGTRLWLPPRQKAAERGELMLLHVGETRHLLRLEPLASTGQIATPPRWGQLELVAVPLSQRQRFEAIVSRRNAGRDGRDALRKLAEDGRILTLETAAPGRLVTTDSPVARIVATWRIATDAEQKPRLEQVSMLRFDAAGKQLPALEDGEAGGREQGWDALLLLLLGICGAGGLWLRARRPATARLQPA